MNEIYYVVFDQEGKPLIDTIHDHSQRNEWLGKIFHYPSGHRIHKIQITKID